MTEVKSKYEEIDEELIRNLCWNVVTQSDFEQTSQNIIKIEKRLEFYRRQTDDYGWAFNWLIDLLDIEVPEGKYGIDMSAIIVTKVRKLTGKD